MSRLLLAGLTGQTGAGKSLVSLFFREAGLAVLDCDQIAREVVFPGGDCLGALVSRFGPDILLPDGNLNRRALGGLVFSDAAALEQLNRVIFPYILAQMRAKAAALEAAGETIVVLDAPTLFESGADRLCGCIVSVLAPAAVRLSRVMERDGLTREAALSRMNSQLNEAFFRARSDFLIENNGSAEALSFRAGEAVSYIRKFFKEFTHGH